MFKLDNDFLQSLGLGALPVDEKNRLLQMIYERLEMNVGMRLAEKMTDQQLDEFEGFIDRNDEAGALKWLETNFPNYKDVVAEELEKLRAEVQAAVPQILSASPAANGSTAQQPAPQQQNTPQMAPPAYAPVPPQQQFAAPPVQQPAYNPTPVQPAQQPVFDPSVQYGTPSLVAPAQPYNPIQPANGYQQPPVAPSFQQPPQTPVQPLYGTPPPPPPANGFTPQ